MWRKFNKWDQKFKISNIELSPKLFNGENELFNREMNLFQMNEKMKEA